MNDISICVLYGLCSVFYNLSSKYLMSSLNLPPFFFLCCQEILIVFYLLITKVYLNSSHFLAILPMTLFFYGNLAFGLIGMHLISLPMYVCIRKLTTLVVFLTEYKSRTQETTFGVVLITLGGICAGIYDLTGSLMGYLVVFASVLMNVGQLIYSKKLADRGFDSNFVFMFSSALVLPLAMSSHYMNEKGFNEILLLLDSWDKLGYLLIGTITSALANFMTIYCSAKVSPIATSVSGNFKDAFSMFLGLVLFKEPFTEMFFYGLLLSTSGAAVFSYSKLKLYSSKHRS